MRRIQKERDRLLRRLARLTGLTGVGLTVLAIWIAPRLNPPELIITSLVALGTGVVVVLSTAQANRVGAIAIVALVVVQIAIIIGADPARSASSLAAVSSAAGLTAASIVLPLSVTRRDRIVLAILAAAVGATVVLVYATGPRFGLTVAVMGFGWGGCLAIAIWLDRAIVRAAHQVAEVGRAHEAERLASESEAQHRQDARLLHDTVLATLSLLAHAGVGVGVTALRQQAGDDARMLRQLRLGAVLAPSPDAIFSPEPEADVLGTTFESVRQRFARIGLDVNWHGAGQLMLPRETLDALLGALGECLENVRRHSGVNEADVTISDDDLMVRAMVSDAGVGFEPDSVDPARLGVSESVVGRLRTAGGRARVFSSPGSGTTVMLEVPKP